MSAETKAAMDAAIAAHVADECDGGMLSGYIMQTQYTSIALIETQETGYLRLVGDEQNFTTTIGLGRYLHASHDAIIADAVSPYGEE